MAPRTESYIAGMTHSEVFLALTNTDPMSRRPLLTIAQADSAIRIAQQEGAWCILHLAVLHFNDGFAIVRNEEQ